MRLSDSEGVIRLGKQLRRSLRRDRRNRIWKVSESIEEKIQVDDIIGAFDILKYWYKKFTGKVLKPSPTDLEATRKVRENLFTKEDMSDECPFDFEYNREPVDDSIPEEEEIRRALFRIRSRKAPGL